MSTTAVFSEFGSIVSVRGGIVDIWFERVPPIHTLLRAGKQGEIAIEFVANRPTRARHCANANPRPCSWHAGHRYAWAAEGAGREGNPFAHVRRIWQRHRWPPSPSQCSMALSSSRVAPSGAALHKIRNLRDGYQNHRRADAVGTRGKTCLLGVAVSERPSAPERSISSRAAGGRQYFLRIANVAAKGQSLQT